MPYFERLLKEVSQLIELQVSSLSEDTKKLLLEIREKLSENKKEYTDEELKLLTRELFEYLEDLWKNLIKIAKPGFEFEPKDRLYFELTATLALIHKTQSSLCNLFVIHYSIENTDPKIGHAVMESVISSFNRRENKSKLFIELIGEDELRSFFSEKANKKERLISTLLKLKINHAEARGRFIELLGQKTLQAIIETLEDFVMIQNQLNQEIFWISLVKNLSFEHFEQMWDNFLMKSLIPSHVGEEKGVALKTNSPSMALSDGTLGFFKNFILRCCLDQRSVNIFLTFLEKIPQNFKLQFVKQLDTDLLQSLLRNEANKISVFDSILKKLSDEDKKAFISSLTKQSLEIIFPNLDESLLKLTSLLGEAGSVRILTSHIAAKIKNFEQLKTVFEYLDERSVCLMASSLSKEGQLESIFPSKFDDPSEINQEFCASLAEIKDEELRRRFIINLPWHRLQKKVQTWEGLINILSLVKKDGFRGSAFRSILEKDCFRKFPDVDGKRLGRYSAKILGLIGEDEHCEFWQYLRQKNPYVFFEKTIELCEILACTSTESHEDFIAFLVDQNRLKEIFSNSNESPEKKIAHLSEILNKLDQKNRSIFINQLITDKVLPSLIESLSPKNIQEILGMPCGLEEKSSVHEPISNLVFLKTS